MYIGRMNEWLQSNSLNYLIDRADSDHKADLRLEAFKMLLADPRVDVNLGDKRTQEKPVHKAALMKNSKFLEELLKHPDVKLNAVHKKHNWKTAIIKAIGKGREKNVKLLAQHPKIIFHWKTNNDQDALMFGLTR